MSDSAPGSEVESDGEPGFRRFDQLAGRELIFSYQESPGGTWELRHCQDESDGLHWPRRDGLMWPHFASVVVLG